MLRYILFFKILLFSDCKKCHSSWKDLCGRLGGGAIVYSWECDILGRARGSLCVQPLLHHTLHLWVTFDATLCTLALTTPAQCILTNKYHSQPGHRVHFCVDFIAPPLTVTIDMLCALYSNWPQLRCRNFSHLTFNHKPCKSQIMKLKCCCLNVVKNHHEYLSFPLRFSAKNLSKYGHTRAGKSDFWKSISKAP